MFTIPVLNTMRLLQAADEFRANLSCELGAVHGLSVNEFFLLMHLDRAPSRKLARVDLAKRMHVSASTVTRMVAPMEKTGMLAREASRRDSRVAFVVLRAAGSKRLREAQKTFASQARALFEDRWTDDELEQLSELLGRLVAGSPANLT